MADTKPSSSPVNGKPQTPAAPSEGTTPGGYEDTPSLRLPFGFVTLGIDTEKYTGQVGIKYGPEKNDWLRMSYIDCKKFIDFCREHRDVFNAQLKIEREKTNTGDL